LFALGSYFENYRNSSQFWDAFSRLRLSISFDKKCLWLHFGGIFSQTHLVTLAEKFFFSKKHDHKIFAKTPIHVCRYYVNESRTTLMLAISRMKF
jgi:hypothetical protein